MQKNKSMKDVNILVSQASTDKDKDSDQDQNELLHGGQFHNFDENKGFGASLRIS